MKFVVTRTSARGEEKPCEVARRSKEIYVGFGDEEKEDVWIVEIEDFSGLLQFVKKCGKGNSSCEGVFLTESSYKGIPFEIEIYDDWRE